MADPTIRNASPPEGSQEEAIPDAPLLEDALEDPTALDRLLGEETWEEEAAPSATTRPRTAIDLWGPPPEPLGGEVPEEALERLVHRPQEALGVVLEAFVRESRAARPGITARDVGTVRQVGDGVASVWGLPQARTDELLLFSSGVMGLVMNLETDWIDCILLGPEGGIQGGDLVWSTGQRIAVPVGERLLGRVVNALGAPVDGKGRLFVDEHRFIERVAPGVIERQAVDEPLHTGLKAVDAIIPIGRGQRELIVGDRQTGKTALALDAIINQRDRDVVCVYVAIGQRKSSVLQVMRTLEDAGAMDHTVIVTASPDDPPALIYLAPYVGTTIAEEFLDRGGDVLIVYDDLTRHADAYRELSLLLRRPPGREAYPGDIFYLHSRLLERAVRLSDALGGGSITALPIVETRRGNISAYVPTNLISITDGQIYLSPELFNQGVRPAVDVGLSVSRVGGAAQTPIMRRVSGQLKLALAQYEEVAHFARFGTEIDRATRQQISRGERLREVLKQPAYAPLELWQQVVILYAATRGYLDELETGRIREYEEGLWRYTRREYRSVMRRIEEERDLTEELERDLEDLMTAYSDHFAGEDRR
jgi:F-type H+-transporting ATPase subunit alpha